MGSAGYDCVVVGSGPGGAGVARELARAGARVLLVERGRADPPSGRARQALRELFVPGRSLFRSGSVLVLRGVTLGGSSMYYFGSAWEPPLDVLRAHGLDLGSDVDALRTELAPAALPRELMGPRATRLLDSARALGLDWQPVPKFVDQHRLRRDGLGAFGAARWTAREFVDDAIGAGARVVTGARAERVIVRSGMACGVELRIGGRTVAVDAGRVVLAAGGLGTPVILRASGIARAGRDFFYDPVLAVSGSVDGLDAGPEPAMLAACDRLAEDGYVLTDLCRPRWLHSALTVAAGRPDRVAAYRSTLTVMVKARDVLSGRLTGRGGVDKPLTGADRSVLGRGEARARDVLRHAGARSVFAAGHVAVHPGGTAKVGDVVDTDLQTEIRGLYVCDASVIPVAWGLPPTFTVMALARRLGRHLVGVPAHPAAARG
ncbi:FAD-dependent oxidoreductase [Pseudonocardia sp.]|uniref:FAD-dependent oxidoreductase n=1 Tax=Pseudonocardia sp. TaxID=60912 RepID=UPI002631A264|nr:FAD-dependent oxidoreductase [Pseudonocardia sp.]